MNLLDALYAIFDSYFKSRQIELYSQVAKVTKIDKKSFSCDVELLRGGSRKFARLSAKLDNGSGLICFPKQGSNVIVSFLDSTTVFITKYSDIDEVVFQDGKNGGIVKISELKSNLDSLKNYVTAMNTALPAAFTAIGAGTAAAGAAGASSYSGSMASQVILFQDMENKNFKH